MTTVDMPAPPTLKEFALMRIASLATKRASRARYQSKQAIPRVTAVLNATIRLALHLAGFGLLTLAGFQWNMIAGLIVAGLSCFVLSTLMTQSAPTTDETMEVKRAPDLRTGRR